MPAGWRFVVSFFGSLILQRYSSYPPGWKDAKTQDLDEFFKALTKVKYETT